ncbi:26.5 kDa heat shock protein, mitochondrial [Diospyros lotus]|uniref:26.5 kDa heat shock protein, mitochondrial n=1 Tax=Diospyros lotus TaxID=55363 RepID=UPI00224F523E|nr:26.5 kDa heat shock protein, mitochondrial [Diospyros lotus]
MALARLALKKLVSPASAPARPLIRSRLWLSTEASAGEVAVSEAGGSKKKSGLFPRRHRRRGGGLWRNTGRRDDFVPALYEFFPSGLGDALLQASRNINRLFENLAPAGLVGRVKEQEDCYKLRFEVPGLGKDDVNIRVEDGFLVIKGEHKEEEEAAGSEDDDDHYWASRSYGYYNTRLALPEDAKAEEIKAEMKDGVLTIMVPRAERSKRDVKEIQID